MNAKECFHTGDLQGPSPPRRTRSSGIPRRPRPAACWPSCSVSPAIWTAPTSTSTPSGTRTRRPCWACPCCGNSSARSLPGGSSTSRAACPNSSARRRPHVRLALEASICVREGKPGEAAAKLDEAEQLRPHLPGTAGGKPFDDFRDVDDLTATFFEVFTSTGQVLLDPQRTRGADRVPRPGTAARPALAAGTHGRERRARRRGLRSRASITARTPTRTTASSWAA